MTVRVYRSTNAGAPVLSGTIGAAIPVIDVLINGTTPMSITTITRSGSIATVTTAVSHGLATLQLVTIAGAVETEYNGEFPVTVIGPAAFTYVIVGTPTTPATGTITAKIAGSGWTKPYTGTNLAMYRQPSGNQYYFRVDDTTTTSARLRGFETAGDVTGGTGPFPTDAQQNGGGFIAKSSTADAVARAWTMVSNGNTVYLWTTGAAGSTLVAQMIMFGDFVSYKAGDTFNTMLSTSSTGATGVANLAELSTSLGTPSTCGYIARSHTQIGTSVALTKFSDSVKLAAATSMGAGGLSYPSPVDGGLYIAPVYISESALSALRGYLPGIWSPCHARPLSHSDTFNGTGSLAGKTFEAFNVFSSGQIHLEISNTW